MDSHLLKLPFIRHHHIGYYDFQLGSLIYSAGWCTGTSDIKHSDSCYKISLYTWDKQLQILPLLQEFKCIFLMLSLQVLRLSLTVSYIHISIHLNTWMFNVLLGGLLILFSVSMQSYCCFIAEQWYDRLGLIWVIRRESGVSSNHVFSIVKFDLQIRMSILHAIVHSDSYIVCTILHDWFSGSSKIIGRSQIGYSWATELVLLLHFRIRCAICQQTLISATKWSTTKGNSTGKLNTAFANMNLIANGEDRALMKSSWCLFKQDKILKSEGVQESVKC